MVGTAQFSPGGVYRYLLTRTWQPALPRLVWILCNPSKADDVKMDPTMRRCVAFSINLGYGGMDILNMFALVSTVKSRLVRMKDPVGPDNDATIFHVTKHAPMIICGWGVPYKKHVERCESVARMLYQHDRKLFYFRLTSQGFPEHPLYLPQTLKPQRWVPW